MAKVTTHVLNSQSGTHAAEVEVKICAERKEIFAGKTDVGGRLHAEIDISSFREEEEFHISFGVGAYFNKGRNNSGGVVIKNSSLTFNMYDNADTYHIPIIISPHGCSYWWSA